MRPVTDQTITESEIIQRCLQNNQQAQRMLYDKYAAKMLGVCVRYISDRTAAEDVMIRGLQKVFSKLGTFKHEGSFEGWIRRIVVNEALTYIRKHKYMYVEKDLETVAHYPDINALNANLEAQDLLAIIEDLPSGYRTIFNLYAIEGYSHKEIAKLLRISESTSKSQLSRARLMLQKQLLKLDQSINKKNKCHEQQGIG